MGLSKAFLQKVVPVMDALSPFLFNLVIDKFRNQTFGPTKPVLQLMAREKCVHLDYAEYIVRQF